MKRRRSPKRGGWVHPLDRAADLLESMDTLAASVDENGVLRLVGYRGELAVYSATFKPAL